jgi:hypothetical protein
MCHTRQVSKFICSRIKKRRDTRLFDFLFFYEKMKRDLNRILIYKCRCDERLRAKSEGSTRLVYTGLRWGQERLKIQTRSRDKRFESVEGEG